MASADREREEAEPYVRAAHAGGDAGKSPGLQGKAVQQGEPRLPLRVTLVHGVSRSINRHARRGPLLHEPPIKAVNQQKSPVQAISKHPCGLPHNKTR